MARRFESNYRMKDGSTRLGEAYFNAVFRDIDLRLHSQEEIDKTWQAAILELNRNGLRRIDEFLAPAYQNIADLAELGFLTATLFEDAPVTFNLGEQVVLLNEGPERDLFHPAPYVTLSVESDPDKFAVARTIDYNRGTGAYAIEIVSRSAALAADLGPHTGIHIAAAAGSLMATLMFVDEAGALRDQTDAIRLATDAIRQQTAQNGAAAVAAAQGHATVAGQHRQAAEQAMTDTQAAALLIAGGPVSSVNGMTGAVKLKSVAGKSLNGEGNLHPKLERVAYEQRGNLRYRVAEADDALIVDKLGVFVFVEGSDEPDDDETCFATDTGRWLLIAVHWDFIAAWMLAEKDENLSPIHADTSVPFSTISSVVTHTVQVIGASLGDAVFVTPINASPYNVDYYAVVSEAGVVSVKFRNSAAGNGSGVNGLWRIIVFKNTGN